MYAVYKINDADIYVIVNKHKDTIRYVFTTFGNTMTILPSYHFVYMYECIGECDDNIKYRIKGDVITNLDTNEVIIPTLYKNNVYYYPIKPIINIIDVQKDVFPILIGRNDKLVELETYELDKSILFYSECNKFICVYDTDKDIYKEVLKSDFVGMDLRSILEKIYEL